MQTLQNRDQILYEVCNKINMIRERSAVGKGLVWL